MHKNSESASSQMCACVSPQLQYIELPKEVPNCHFLAANGIIKLIKYLYIFFDSVRTWCFDDTFVAFVGI